MYKRILVPLDGSSMGDRVLPYVRDLGKKLDAKVELFRIYYPEPEFFPRAIRVPRPASSFGVLP